VIGDSVVMLSDAVREPARISGLFLYVPNVDKTIAKAVKAGAKILMPAEDTFWGDRFGRVEDPYGNSWAIATHIEDVSPAELKKRSKAMAKAMEPKD
jgi:PhnB protein